MDSEKEEALTAANWPEIVRRIRARTPARLLNGRAGAAYRTETQLELREAHAAARDAVRAEMDIQAIFGAVSLDRSKLFQVSTRARNKEEYLLHPDLGRHFTDAARDEILRRCTKGNDLQIAIGDGLSVAAVAAQVPALFPILCELAVSRGWSVGQTFAIRYCRVGILNEIGELLEPKVVVLLIGERPGLATAESLSAYMAYRPDSTHTDADRNLISNIHTRGLIASKAAERILQFARHMMAARLSGCNLRIEERSAPRSAIESDT